MKRFKRKQIVPAVVGRLRLWVLRQFRWATAAEHLGTSTAARVEWLPAARGRGAADVRGAEGDAVAVAVAVTGALLLRP